MREELNEHFKPNISRTVLYLLVPVEGTGVTIIFVYAFSHWTTFVAQTGAVFAFLCWILAAIGYMALAWFAVKILRGFIEALLTLARGASEVHQRITETKQIRARVELLHTADNYVIYKQQGQIVVLPVGSGQRLLAQPAIETDIEEVEETPAALPMPILTFAELLEQGVIQAAIKAGQLILGYDMEAGSFRYGDWLDLYSCGIGGVSGSGKSTTTRFLLFQAALAGARFIFIDPHIGDPEDSLAYQFSQLPASIHQIKPCNGQAPNVLKRVRWLAKELERRELTGRKTPFLIFIIDEFNEQMRVKEVREELANLLLNIEQGGRKFGIFAMLIGQKWAESDLGGKGFGASIRSSLASKLAHRFSDEDQAKRFMGSKHGRKLLELEKGRWLFYDTSGKTSNMITPATYAEDGAAVAQLLEQRTPVYTPETSLETALKPAQIAGFLPETAPHKVIQLPARNQDERGESEQETSPETNRIAQLASAVISLQAEGKTQPEIMRAVWNVSPGGTDAYNTAKEEWKSVMSYIKGQIGA